MTTVAIMQPTYLPWCGYFDMLDQADVFVLLDTVAVSKQSWQTRNRIRARDGNVVWLSVPTNATPGMSLIEVAISGTHWKAKHIRTIENAYSAAAHWQDLAPLLSQFRRPWPSLADMTRDLVWELADLLGISHGICWASSMTELSDDPIERLASICEYFNAREYLSPEGAHGYLDGHDIGVPVRWHQYEHPIYSQGDAPWCSHLSVVDLLAWHGPGSLDIIRSGRR